MDSGVANSDVWVDVARSCYLRRSLAGVDLLVCVDDGICDWRGLFNSMWGNFLVLRIYRIAGTCELATSRLALNDVLCDLECLTLHWLQLYLLLFPLRYMGRPFVHLQSRDLFFSRSRSFLHPACSRFSLIYSSSPTRPHSTLNSTSKRLHWHCHPTQRIRPCATARDITITAQLHEKSPSPCAGSPASTLSSKRARRSTSSILSHLLAARPSHLDHRPHLLSNARVVHINSFSPRSRRCSSTSTSTPRAAVTSNCILTTQTKAKKASNMSSVTPNTAPHQGAIAATGSRKRKAAATPRTKITVKEEEPDVTADDTVEDIKPKRRGAKKAKTIDETAKVEEKAKKPTKSTTKPAKILPPLAQRTQDIKLRIGAHVSIAGGKSCLSTDDSKRPIANTSWTTVV